jgi:hypothetical protein
VPEAHPTRLLEEVDGLRVRAGPPALDVVDTELVESLGDAELVGEAEGAPSRSVVS